MKNEERSAALRARAREVLRHNASTGVLAPNFGAGEAWLNVSRALSLRSDLAGKLVLVHFWTSSSIDCRHVLSDLGFLEEKYRGEPFVVIGCHAAKFANETNVERVRDALLRLEVEHPVVLDHEFAIWKRFDVRAWPTLMLISPDGRVLGNVAGVGQLAVLDVLIEQALELYHGDHGGFDHSKLPLRLERTRQFPRELCFPGKLIADPLARRLYVADSGHHRVLELGFDGRFVRQFGSGMPGFVDGAVHEARLRGPQGLALWRGELIVADALNHALRRIDLASGSISTLAGTGRLRLESSSSGSARETALGSPWDVLVHGQRLFIAMAGDRRVWEYAFADDAVRPLAGDGKAALRDGPFEQASFAQPSALAAHGSRLFVADAESSALRELNLDSNVVTTLLGGTRGSDDLVHVGDEDGAGHGRRLQYPLGLALDPHSPHDGVLAYVADTYNHEIKLIDAELAFASTYAGAREAGFVDGDCEAARFCEPGGLALSEGQLFVADSNNHALRRIDLEQHVVTTLDTSSVPLPLHALTQTRDVEPHGEEWPYLPHTVRHAPLKRRLASGNAELLIEVTLPAGASLAPHAPAQFRVLREGGLVAARHVVGRIDALVTSIPLGVAGPGLLRVQTILYVSASDRTCTMHSHEWRLEIDVHERAGKTCILALTLGDDARG